MSKIDTTNVVAWQSVHYGIPIDETHDPAEAQKWFDSGVTVRPLYTSPPASKPWVGLTDEQIKLIMDGRGEEGDDDYVKPAFDPFGISEDDLMNFVRAIEAKLREKNGGTK